MDMTWGVRAFADESAASSAFVAVSPDSGFSAAASALAALSAWKLGASGSSSTRRCFYIGQLPQTHSP